MPEQKALPAPVMISTCARDFSTCRQRGQQFIDQFVGDCVAFVRAVESDSGTTVVVIEQKSIEVHVYSRQ